jgi:snurportin-1
MHDGTDNQMLAHPNVAHTHGDCIVPNTVIRSRLVGKHLLPAFPSILPQNTILDCILDQNWTKNGILHILDVIKWKGQDIGDCETSFR